MTSEFICGQARAGEGRRGRLTIGTSRVSEYSTLHWGPLLQNWQACCLLLEWDQMETQYRLRLCWGHDPMSAVLPCSSENCVRGKWVCALKHILVWRLDSIYADIFVCMCACVHCVCVCVILYSVCCPLCNLLWLTLTSWATATRSGTTGPRATNVYFDPAVQPKHGRDYPYQIYLYLSASVYRSSVGKICFVALMM